MVVFNRCGFFFFFVGWVIVRLGVFFGRSNRCEIGIVWGFNGSAEINYVIKKETGYDESSRN